MKRPALLISVSMRPNRSSACSVTRRAVAASAMSPGTARTFGSVEVGIEREVATTA
jgi:hypothetical protein